MKLTSALKEMREIPDSIKGVTVIATVALFVAITALMIAVGKNGAR